MNVPIQLEYLSLQKYGKTAAIGGYLENRIRIKVSAGNLTFKITF
jgi:hypothetical protein